MNRINRTITIIIIAIIVGCSCAIIASLPQRNGSVNEDLTPENTFVIPNAKSLTIPSVLKNFGLFYYKNDVTYNVLDDNLPSIDESKPIIIYTRHEIG